MRYFKSLFSRSLEPVKFGNSWFYPVGSASDIFKAQENYLKDFQTVPELNAIINIRARAMASWKLSIQSKTTGKEQPSNESLVRILRSPNWFQGQGEFWKQSSTFRDIYGNEFLYFLRPTGMASTYKGLFTINPSKITVVYKSSTLPFMESTDDFVEYWYDTGNEKIKLDKANIIHLNDNRVDPTKFLSGTSKLQSLQPVIHNIREAYKKRNVVLRMPIGIMSNGQSDAIGQAVPMNPEEKQSAQTALRDHGQNAIITNLAIKYDSMAINANAMGLFQEVREDVGRLCDAFGVPYEILASEKGVTFANLKEAKKQFYEEGIVQDAQEKVDALNMYLETDKKSWHIVADFNHLPVFAEDVKQRALSLNQLTTALDKALAVGAITIEQYKNELAKFGIL